jgi:hypothetical protein
MFYSLFICILGLFLIIAFQGASFIQVSFQEFLDNTTWFGQLIFWIFIAAEAIFIIFVQWISIGPNLGRSNDLIKAAFAFYTLMFATMIVQVVYWIM